MLATAFQMSHFRKFMEEYGPLPTALATTIAELQEDPSPENTCAIETTDAYLIYMHKY